MRAYMCVYTYIHDFNYSFGLISLKTAIACILKFFLTFYCSLHIIHVYIILYTIYFYKTLSNFIPV